MAWLMSHLLDLPLNRTDPVEILRRLLRLPLLNHQLLMGDLLRLLVALPVNASNLSEQVMQLVICKGTPELDWSTNHTQKTDRLVNLRYCELALRLLHLHLRELRRRRL